MDRPFRTKRVDASNSPSIRVVVADDDPSAAFSLHAQLTNLGYQVVAQATSDREMVALVRQLRPDLVIVDVNVPRVDALRAVDQIDQDASCPIILVSACSGRELMQQACSLSAVQAYLVKPVNEEDLEPAIALALSRFRQIQELQHLKWLANDVNTQLDIKQARAYLAANRHWSMAEAQWWIEQEARAKKASLDEIARAIVAETTVEYRHDVPA